MTLVPIREHFTEPERLSPAWTLHKGRKKAECSVWSHVLGFELRLDAGGHLLQTEVCRTQDDLIRVQEEWRVALVGKGWS
jgi:hypothetical protein